MTAPREICLADRMRPAFADERALVQSVVDALNDEWSRHGVAGAAIIDAAFADGAISISTRPGAQALSVAVVSHHVRAARATRRAAA